MPSSQATAARRATYEDILALPEHLVGEILSPSTAATDRAVKMPIYAREQVPFLWLIDPDARTLEVYERQGDAHWLLLETLSDDTDVSLPPFEATLFSLSNLWA